MRVKKRGDETPCNIKEFIDRVVSSPHDELAERLRGFTAWDFGKGDFSHWVDLFNHLDEYFEKCLKPRADLCLKGKLEDDVVFPRETCLEILRVTRIIMDNCSNRHLYNSVEHLSSLLAAEDKDLVNMSLETLIVFVRKSPPSLRGIRWQSEPTLNPRLFALSQGPGGKEEGLGIVACTASGQEEEISKHPNGCTLHFEFYEDPEDPKKKKTEGEVGSKAGLRSIRIPDLQNRPDSDHQICMELAERYNVPEDLRFSLLARIRAARGFSTLEGRRQLVRVGYHRLSFLCRRTRTTTIWQRSS